MEKPTHTGRVYLWMRTLASPILWGANAFLALLLWGDGIINTFPETYEYSRYLAPITDLHWHWKVIITLVLNIILFVELSFRAVGKGERQRDEYYSKLQQIEQARPHIILREPHAEYVEPVHIQAVGSTTTAVSLIRVRFVNSPTGPPLPNSVARGVRAKVRFFESAPEGRLLLMIEGKWAESDQPSIRDFRDYRNDLLKIDFGIEEEHSLDIAFRDDQTGEFYAFNHDNYSYPQMKKPEHLLAGQHFLVRISLFGPWVDETFEFLFANDSFETDPLRPLSLSRPLRMHA
jgi:hypothetical protein